MSFVKDMLKARYDRHRMPPEMYPDMEERYDRARRDYESDYARRDYRRSDSTYQEPRYDSRRRDYEYDRERSDYRGYDMRGSDYRGYDYSKDSSQMTYGKMSQEDIEKWSEKLENSDGTRGKHFKKDQIEHVAKQIGFDMHRVGGEKVFCMAMNMMYADYCGVAKKFGADTPLFYAEMAKAFLEDKDFKGEPEEKLWLYYKCIVESEN
jgi:hypothetical protein